jgi:hypothetical protein
MDLATLSLILASVTLSAFAQISFKFGLSKTARTAAGLLDALFTPGVFRPNRVLVPCYG